MVNVIGLGYIGLPTVLMLAAHGIEVVGTDCDAVRIEALRTKRVPFVEAGMEELYDAAVEGGIRFMTQCVPAQIYILALPTPCAEGSRQADMTFITDALRHVCDVCPPDAVIVLESTVPPGTTDSVIRPLLVGRNIRLAHAPERIMPGRMIEELLYNDRTIGVDDPATGEELRALYTSFCRGDIFLTDVRTAEMSKVAENAFRAVQIAFANELGRLCRHTGVDVYELIRICNRHPRVEILQPGPGVGGHCIPVDPWFLAGECPGTVPLTEAALHVNEGMPEYVLSRLYEVMAESGVRDASRVGIYGLTYKENVDDCRESPTLALLCAHARSGGSAFAVYDPLAGEVVCARRYSCLDAFLMAVDLVVIMVGHAEIEKHCAEFADKIVLDTRNIPSLRAVCRRYIRLF